MRTRLRCLLWLSGTPGNSLLIHFDLAGRAIAPERERQLQHDSLRGFLVSLTERCPVTIPLPVPLGLARDLPSNIDMAGTYVWDGFLHDSGKWDGVLYPVVDYVVLLDDPWRQGKLKDLVGELAADELLEKKLVEKWRGHSRDSSREGFPANYSAQMDETTLLRLAVNDLKGALSWIGKRCCTAGHETRRPVLEDARELRDDLDEWITRLAKVTEEQGAK